MQYSQKSTLLTLSFPKSPCLHMTYNPFSQIWPNLQCHKTTFSASIDVTTDDFPISDSPIKWFKPLLTLSIPFSILLTYPESSSIPSEIRFVESFGTYLPSKFSPYYQTSWCELYQFLQLDMFDYYPSSLFHHWLAHNPKAIPCCISYDKCNLNQESNLDYISLLTPTIPHHYHSHH